MPKADDLYLGHMLDMAKKAHGKVQGVGKATYNADENLRLALAYLIQVIGEAAQRVSPEGRQAYPEIPWHQIVGMRHKIVHDYMEVDTDIVWQVATRDLPVLIAALEHFAPDTS